MEKTAIQTIEEKTMNSNHCGTELIWGGDFDIDPDRELEEFVVETNFTCPKCNSFVLFYHHKSLY